jgi:phosphatidylinositol kinase/protein kinase (PI-3  family)
MQVMEKLKNIFDNAGINLWIRIYDIIVISANSGIIGKLFTPQNTHEFARIHPGYNIA